MSDSLKFFCVAIGLFGLTGCSSEPTHTEINRHDYVWHVEEKTEALPNAKAETKTEFFFVSENFPDNCRWEDFVRVVDGDTVIVGDDERVRFIGIDTPEIKHPDKPLDPRGLVSSQTLKDLLAGSEQLCLIQDSIGDKIDKYDRTLAYLFTVNGTDLNAELVQSGWAKGYFYFPFERQEEFRVYEAQAQAKKIGLWEK